MLKQNLSSRPFYNERAVSLVLGAVAVVALGLTAFNVTEILSLSSQWSGYRTDVERDTQAAATIRQQTATTQAGLEMPVLTGLLASTREANALIDQRTFSWTVFFDYIGRTLPYDVRLVAVAPRLEQGKFLVTMLVVARQPEDLETFFRSLRETNAFSNVTSTAEQINDDGTLRADVYADYTPPKLAPPGEAPVPAVPTTGRGGRP